MHGLRLKYVIVSLLLAVLFAYPFVLLPFGTDQSIFAYIGSIINKGGMPYRDAWDVKPPLIYYIYSLGLQIFGHSIIGLRCFDLVYFILTIIAMYYLGALLFGKKEGICAGVLLGILYFFVNGWWSFSQCESFMLLPMIVSSYLCCCGIKKNNLMRLLCSGVFLGIVFMTKLTGIVMAIPIGLYIIYSAFYSMENREVQHVALYIFVVLTGFLLSTGCIVLWFCIRGALSEMYYTLFVYDPAYLKSASELRTDYVHLSLLGFMRRYLFVLFPALLSLFSINNRKTISENILVYGWFFSAVLGFFMQRRYYHYHMLPVIAPLSLLGAQGLVALYSAPAGKKQISLMIKKIAFVSIFIFLLFSAVWQHICFTYRFTIDLMHKNGNREFYNGFFSSPGVFSFNTTVKAAQYIKNHTSPNDFIFVWGFQPLFYFLSEREAPTRFFFNSPLIAPFNEKKTEWRKDVLADLERTPPHYIIVAEDDSLVNTLMSGVNKDSRTMLREFPELLMLLKKQYVIERSIDNLFLYHYAGK